MNHFEDAESMALWSRAQLNPILREYLYHIPNGGKRNAREAARMKRMGTRPGVHDYHLPIARGCYHSLWIELKPDVKGYSPSISHNQIGWREKMRNNGNAAFIVKGWPKAISIMLLYLDLVDGQSLSVASKGNFDYV